MLIRYAFIVLGLVPLCIHSAGLSPYLPLKLSPEIEAHIERLMSVSAAVPLTKPYKASEVNARNQAIKDQYPELYQRINNYLKRYKVERGLTHGSASLSLTNRNKKALPNQRNIKHDSNYQLSLGGLSYIGPYVYVASGMAYAQGEGVIHHNTHISLGYEYAQIELGYREHWFSPFQDSAMLVSTHAKSSPSLTISNASPITSWNIRYELFYSQLEETQGIVLGKEVFTGRPKLAGLHLSLTPFDYWTLGASRTFQFGGGKREVTFSDVLKAFFDPAGKDNVGDVNTDDPNFEFGNQQAAISSKFNFELGMPISLYFEYAGEDTVSESNFQLGNVSKSVGIHLPFITNNLSARYEYSDWTNAWYVHHLYRMGYSNSGQIMGHWGAGERAFGNDTPATTHAINLNWQLAANQLIDVNVRIVQNTDKSQFNYSDGYELNSTYSYATDKGFWGLELNAGKDVFQQRFYRLSAFYRW